MGANVSKEDGEEHDRAGKVFPLGGAFLGMLMLRSANRTKLCIRLFSHCRRWKRLNLSLAREPLDSNLGNGWGPIYNDGANRVAECVSLQLLQTWGQSFEWALLAVAYCTASVGLFRGGYFSKLTSV